MIDFIIYDSAGQIIRTGICQSELLNQQRLNEVEFVLTGYADLFTQYIDQGKANARPAQPTGINKTDLTADGVDVIAISNAPLGTFTATNTATKETVSGPISGTDTFATTIPGTYKIKIEAWPFLDFETTIEAI